SFFSRAIVDILELFYGNWIQRFPRIETRAVHRLATLPADQAWLRAANSLRCLRSRTAARRSSIKSRSTSQYLSEEKSSEGVWSTSVVSSLVIISGRGLPDNLAEFRRLRLDFAFRDRVRVVRPAPMNSPQGFNITMGRAVVRNRRNI